MNEFDALENWLSVPAFLIIIIALIAWSLVWKGVALWRAASLRHKGWFVALLIINTFGILEIIYILTAGRQREKSVLNT